MNRRLLVGTAGGALLLAGGIVAGGTVADVTPAPAPAPAIGPAVQETLAEGQYVGPCSIVTPPEPDPCQAAQLVLRYQFLGEIVNAAYHRKWVAANPGEVARLGAIMAAPRCSIFSDPQPQTMITFYGAALADAIEAYACAKGTEPIVWPAPNPPPLAGSKDRKAPSPPGALQVTP